MAWVWVGRDDPYEGYRAPARDEPYDHEFEFSVLELDTPLPRSGSIYSREVWDKAAVEYQKRIDRKRSLGPAGPGMALKDCRFLITALWVEGSTVKIRLRPLNTGEGRHFFILLSPEVQAVRPIRWFPVGVGDVKDNVVRDYVLQGFDYRLEDEEGFRCEC